MHCAQLLTNGGASDLPSTTLNGSAPPKQAAKPQAEIEGNEAPMEEGYGSSDSEGEDGAGARGDDEVEPRDVADGGVTLHGLIRRMSKLADDRCACNSLCSDL